MEYTECFRVNSSRIAVRIIAGMPAGFYEGYTEEIHEVLVYDLTAEGQ